MAKGWQSSEQILRELGEKMSCNGETCPYSWMLHLIPWEDLRNTLFLKQRNWWRMAEG